MGEDIAGHTEDGPIKGEMCAILHPNFIRAGTSRARTPESDLEEAIGLAAAIELKVQHAEIIRVNKAMPGMLFGKGTVERVADIIHGKDDNDEDDAMSYFEKLRDEG